MKKGFTKIVFCVDRSGSMITIADDMIGGFNVFIKTQRENKVGECTVSFNQFDDVYEEVYKNVNVNDVKDLTSKTFIPRNSTALYDAVGRTINSVGEELSLLKEEDRPERVMVVIITDGEENSSKEFTSEKIKSMVKLQTDTYKWQFVYIGANQDSWNVGQSLGVCGVNTLAYASVGSNASTSSYAMWNTLASNTVNYRSAAVNDMSFDDASRKEQEELIKTSV